MALNAEMGACRGGEVVAAEVCGVGCRAVSPYNFF